MNAKHPNHHRTKDLVRLFGAMQDLHDKLAIIIQAKIDAMRSADMDTLRGQADKERELIQRIHEREGLRCQLMDEIGKGLGLPSQASRVLPVSQLADRLNESERQLLLKAADSLRDSVAKVARVNRVASRISGDLLRHLQWVFASVRPKDASPTGYCGNGAVVAGADQRIFEMVG